MWHTDRNTGKTLIYINILSHTCTHAHTHTHTVSHRRNKVVTKSVQQKCVSTVDVYVHCAHSCFQGVWKRMLGVLFYYYAIFL